MKDLTILVICIVLVIGIVSASMLFYLRWQEEVPGQREAFGGKIFSRFVEPKENVGVCPTSLPEYQAIMQGDIEWKDAD